MKALYNNFRHFSGLNRLTRLFAKRLHPFVVCYHQVNPVEMEAHIRYLQRHFTIKNINDLRADDRGCCAVTLDDCIREDFHKAAQLAESLSCPITFYVPTGYAANNASMWAMKLKWMLQQTMPNNWRGTFDDLCSTWSNAGQQTGALEHQADEMLQEQGLKATAIPDALRVIGPEEIQRFRASTCVFFESHSVTHPFLYLCTEPEIKTELIDSKSFIEGLTGQEVRSFCYPYGSNKIIGSHAPALAALFYQNATTLVSGIFTENDPFRIPRIGVYPGDSVAYLATKIYHFQNLQWAGL